MTIRLFAALRTAVLPVVLVLGTVALFWPFIVPAFAQAVTTPPAPVVVTPATTAVVVPVGGIATDVLTILQAVVTAAWIGLLGIVIRFLPQTVQGFVRTLLTAQVEQLVQRSIDWGFNSVKGAVKDQTLTVNAGSQVLAHALDYVFSNGWPWLLKWAGGPDGIVQKILARLPLAPETTASEVAAALPLAQQQSQLVPPAT